MSAIVSLINSVTSVSLLPPMEAVLEETVAAVSGCKWSSGGGTEVVTSVDVTVTSWLALNRCFGCIGSDRWQC